MLEVINIKEVKLNGDKNLRYKKILSYTIIYLLFFMSIPLFFSPARLQNLPELNTYKGELKFSGDNAFSILQQIIKNYPDRVIGSQASRDCATFVEREFLKAGLNTTIEEYQSFLASKKVEGINVIGISPGISKEVVVIGAHRDVVSKSLGAEDNGSGTASMIELANVLCKEEHYYTYIFVSFDGEEYGKSGSIEFVKSHADLDIKLAYILDMTGYADSDSIAFYPYMTNESAAPIWTFAMSNTILKQESLVPYYFGPLANIKTYFNGLFINFFYYKLFGHVNTDSEAFIKSKIPAIGVMAGGGKVGSRKETYWGRKIHTPQDNMEEVSAKTLELTGTFSEKYIKSLELNTFGWLLKGKYYVLDGYKYVSPINIYLFLAYLLALVLILNMLTFKLNSIKFRTYINFLLIESKAILITALLTILIMLSFDLLKSEVAKFLPKVVRGGLLGIVAVGVVVCIIFFRHVIIKFTDNELGEYLKMKSCLLDNMYLAISMLFLTVLNPIEVLCLVLVPILLVSRISYKTTRGKIICYAMFIFCLAIEGYIVKAFLGNAILQLTFKSTTSLYLCLVLWISSFVYLFYPFKFKILDLGNKGLNKITEAER